MPCTRTRSRHDVGHSWMHTWLALPAITTPRPSRRCEPSLQTSHGQTRGKERGASEEMHQSGVVIPNHRRGVMTDPCGPRGWWQVAPDGQRPGRRVGPPAGPVRGRGAHHLASHIQGSRGGASLGVSPCWCRRACVFVQVSSLHAQGHVHDSCGARSSRAARSWRGVEAGHQLAVRGAGSCEVLISFLELEA
jgi:hypothetical protein